MIRVPALSRPLPAVAGGDGTPRSGAQSYWVDFATTPTTTAEPISITADDGWSCARTHAQDVAGDVAVASVPGAQLDVR